MSTLLIQKHALTLAAAKKALEAVEDTATRLGIAASIAVVDDGGHVLGLHRMDGVGAGTVEVAIGKARAAALFKTETKNFQAGLDAGVTSLLTLGVITFGGGVPVVYESATIGAIGVSGGTPEQDAEAANAGVKAIIR
jgi:glc operon protein GlcG